MGELPIIQGYPYHFDGELLFDLSTQYQLNNEIQFDAKINNLLNTNPPLIANDATLEALLDSSPLYPEFVLGRVFGIGARYTWECITFPVYSVGGRDARDKVGVVIHSFCSQPDNVKRGT